MLWGGAGNGAEGAGSKMGFPTIFGVMHKALTNFLDFGFPDFTLWKVHAVCALRTKSIQQLAANNSLNSHGNSGCSPTMSMS